ncbi:MAG: hypothetical protein J6P60_05315, partial [Lachnospiraceae bacterium]|nr:hypothetical protein [Lachnospiraceae bacterium]
HTQALSMLPVVWGSVEQQMPSPLAIHVTAGQDDGITYEADTTFSGNEVDLIRFRLPQEAVDLLREGADERSDKDGNLLEFVFETDGEEHKFTFSGEGGELLIPVYSSPYWKKNDRITRFCIRSQGKTEAWNALLKEADVTFYSYWQ